MNWMIKSSKKNMYGNAKRSPCKAKRGGFQGMGTFSVVCKQDFIFRFNWSVGQQAHANL